MIVQARQYVSEPCLRIDVIELCGLDQGVDRRGAPASGIGACKGPVVTYASGVGRLLFEVRA